MKTHKLKQKKDSINKPIPDLKAQFLAFLGQNYIVFIFSLIILLKISYFSYLNIMWPKETIVFQFILYNLAFISVVIIPAYFIKKHKFTYLIILDIFVSLVLLIDTIYMRYFDTLPVVSLLSSSGQLGPNLVDWVGSLLRPKDYYIFIDIVLLLGLLLIPRIRKYIFKNPKIKTLQAAIVVTIVTLIAVATLITVGSKKMLPTVFNTISENKVVTTNVGLFGAHIMDISRNFIYLFDRPSKAQQKDLFIIINKYSKKLKDNNKTGIAKNKRIIMIQVESLNNSLIDKTIDGQEITPNINSFEKNSNYFANHYFNVGAGGTSDVDFGVNTSLPAIADSSAMVMYAKDNFTGLAKELDKLNYQTSAFHANNRGYWNRDTVFKSFGYDNFYARDNYQRGVDINMGLADKSFFTQSITKMKKEPTSSLDYLITLSSHYSFDIPQEHWSLSLNEKDYTKLSFGYLESIHYADEAIGEFIAELKQNNMYDDSVIIIYGDHTAKYDAFTTDQGYIDPGTIAGKRIPLFIKLPGQTTTSKSMVATSELDIMPTILNLVGVKTDAPMFGRDVFENDSTFFYTTTYDSNLEQIITEKQKYLINPDAKCYQYIDDMSTKTALSDCDPLLVKRAEIQANTESLIRNNLFDKYLKFVKTK